MNTRSSAPRSPLHPLHALLLAFPVALFTGALIADITFLNSSEMQWSNFAAWLNAGALAVGAVTLLWAVAGAVRFRAKVRRAGLYPALLAIMWVIGLVNAFQHSRDGWSSVGTVGLLLSVLSAGFALASGWVAYSGTRNA